MRSLRVCLPTAGVEDSVYLRRGGCNETQGQVTLVKVTRTGSEASHTYEPLVTRAPLTGLEPGTYYVTTGESAGYSADALRFPPPRLTQYRRSGRNFSQAPSSEEGWAIDLGFVVW